MILIIGAVGFWGKNLIVAYYPETIKLYNFLEIKISPNISNFEVVNLKAENKEDIILVSGKFFNKSFLPSLSPLIRVDVLDKQGKIIENFDIAGEEKTINSQGYNYFNTEIYLSDEKVSEFYEVSADLVSEIKN